MPNRKSCPEPIRSHAAAIGETTPTAAEHVRTATATAVLLRLAALLARVAASEHRAALENEAGTRPNNHEV
jgi:hypothetical protein